MDDKWSLYNSKTQERKEHQSLNDLRALMVAIPRDEQRFWFAWCDTMDSWEAAIDVLLEKTRPSLSSQSREPISNLNFVEIEYESDEVTQIPTIDLSEPENQVIAIERVKPENPKIDLNDKVDKTEKSGFDRRRYPRYHARFRVMIKSENLTFRTFSLDVSLGGLAIETAVPPGLVGATCQVQIGHPNLGETVHFTAKLLTTRNESKYFSFVRSPQDSLNRLQRWLGGFEPMKRAI